MSMESQEHDREVMDEISDKRLARGYFEELNSSQEDFMIESGMENFRDDRIDEEAKTKLCDWCREKVWANQIHEVLIEEGERASLCDICFAEHQKGR